MPIKYITQGVQQIVDHKSNNIPRCKMSFYFFTLYLTLKLTLKRDHIIYIFTI